jgi:hypothetical protein
VRRPASVQLAHVGLDAIEDDVLRLAPGGLRGVLEVDGRDLGLLGDGEQEAALAGFAAFLNGLTFPVQVLVRVLPVDAEAYLGGLERRVRDLPAGWSGASEGGLAGLGRDHIAFLRQLARSHTLLERRCYVVVPAGASDGDPAGEQRWAWAWPLWAPPARRAGPAEAPDLRNQLRLRCEDVRAQLGRCGLVARRLGGAELARLLYACWCPELSRVQRLRPDLAAATAPVVRSPAPATGPTRSGPGGDPALPFQANGSDGSRPGDGSTPTPPRRSL